MLTAIAAAAIRRIRMNLGKLTMHNVKLFMTVPLIPFLNLVDDGAADVESQACADGVFAYFEETVKEVTGIFF